MKTIVLILILVVSGSFISGCATNASVGTPSHSVSVGAAAN